MGLVCDPPVSPPSAAESGAEDGGGRHHLRLLLVSQDDLAGARHLFVSWVLRSPAPAYVYGDSVNWALARGTYKSHAKPHFRTYVLNFTASTTVLVRQNLSGSAKKRDISGALPLFTEEGGGSQLGKSFRSKIGLESREFRRASANGWN